MICKYCGVETHYEYEIDTCNMCSWVKTVGHTVPTHIPQEQKERYLDRLMKGKPNDR